MTIKTKIMSNFQQVKSNFSFLSFSLILLGITASIFFYPVFIALTWPLQVLALVTFASSLALVAKIASVIQEKLKPSQAEIQPEQIEVSDPSQSPLAHPQTVSLNQQSLVQSFAYLRALRVFLETKSYDLRQQLSTWSPRIIISSVNNLAVLTQLQKRFWEIQRFSSKTSLLSQDERADELGQVEGASYQIAATQADLIDIESLHSLTHQKSASLELGALNPLRAQLLVYLRVLLETKSYDLRQQLSTWSPKIIISPVNYLAVLLTQLQKRVWEIQRLSSKTSLVSQDERADEPGQVEEASYQIAAAARETVSNGRSSHQMTAPELNLELRAGRQRANSTIPPRGENALGRKTRSAPPKLSILGNQVDEVMWQDNSPFNHGQQSKILSPGYSEYSSPTALFYNAIPTPTDSFWPSNLTPMWSGTSLTLTSINSLHPVFANSDSQNHPFSPLTPLTTFRSDQRSSESTIPGSFPVGRTSPDESGSRLSFSDSDDLLRSEGAPPARETYEAISIQRDSVISEQNCMLGSRSEIPEPVFMSLWMIQAREKFVANDIPRFNSRPVSSMALLTASEQSVAPSMKVGRESRSFSLVSAAFSNQTMPFFDWSEGRLLTSGGLQISFNGVLIALPPLSVFNSTPLRFQNEISEKEELVSVTQNSTSSMEVMLKPAPVQSISAKNVFDWIRVLSWNTFFKSQAMVLPQFAFDFYKQFLKEFNFAEMLTRKRITYEVSAPKLENDDKTLDGLVFYDNPSIDHNPANLFKAAKLESVNTNDPCKAPKYSRPFAEPDIDPVVIVNCTDINRAPWRRKLPKPRVYEPIVPFNENFSQLSVVPKVESSTKSLQPQVYEPGVHPNENSSQQSVAPKVELSTELHQVDATIHSCQATDPLLVTPPRESRGIQFTPTRIQENLFTGASPLPKLSPQGKIQLAKEIAEGRVLWQSLNSCQRIQLKDFLRTQALSNDKGVDEAIEPCTARKQLFCENLEATEVRPVAEAQALSIAEQQTNDSMAPLPKERARRFFANSSNLKLKLKRSSVDADNDGGSEPDCTPKPECELPPAKIRRDMLTSRFRP